MIFEFIFLLRLIYGIGKFYLRFEKSYLYLTYLSLT